MSAMRWRPWPCLLLLAFSLSGAAQAQLLNNDKEARGAARLNAEKIENITGLIRDLGEQNRELREQLSTIRKQLTSLSQQQQQLQQQLRESRGEMEEMRQSSEQQRAEMEKYLNNPQIAAKISALTEKIANLEQYITLPPEQDLYNAAFDKLQKEMYEQAIAGFGNMIDLYPQGQFSVNARYWISKARLALGEYEQAQSEAETLMAEYPDNGRQAETLLIIAAAMRGLGRDKEARAQLSVLLEQFPTSLAADEARQLLAQ